MPLSYSVRPHTDTSTVRALAPSTRIPAAVELTVVVADEEYVLLTFAAADGHFAGSTELWGAEHARDLAEGLRGFPRSPTDTRRFQLGSDDLQVADGFVEIDAQCVDRAGHAMLQIGITDKATRGGLRGRHVRVHLAIEPPAIDAFVSALVAWDFKPGSTVTLPGAA